MLQIGIYTSSAGSLYLDISPRASQVVIVNGEHGFGTLTAFVKMSLWEAFMLYDRPGIPHVQVTEYGTEVWSGRLEDVAIVAGGVRITAFGYWRALSDVPYTALWSKTGVAGFRPTLLSEIAGRDPNLYQFDNNNRIFIGLTKNTVYANNSNLGEMVYQSPDGGAVGQLEALSFSYDMTLPANWQFRVVGYNSGFTSQQILLAAIAATGVNQTGTQTLTFAGTIRQFVAFEIYNLTGANYTWLGETGANWLIITNVRMASTTSAALYADEIARAMAFTVNATNPAQLSASTALINSPTVDLTDEVYLDAYPADILDRLARLGDNSSPVALYETGVWEAQMLNFQKRGTTAKTWYVDISSLELERTVNALYNSVYADYQEAAGRTLRTTVNADSDSVSRYGLTRRKAIQTTTTSSAFAGTQRDAALQDGKDPQPRIGIAFGPRVYDAAGSAYPLWMVRAWDTLVLRNLPATLSTSLDRIRQFRIIEARLDVDSNVLTVTPEQFVPSLSVIVARTAAGIRK